MIVEYSANLDGQVDMRGLSTTLSRAILASGLFELGAVRVRAFSARTYAIADQLPENSFIDLSFRIGTGRSEEEKKRVGESIFASATEFLGQQLAGQHFALSLEVREIDPALSWKRNAMHARLRAKNEAQ
jgi:5-carboxymethyl-2-hydroxymuconate isomerase